jgi:hypothetical protein
MLNIKEIRPLANYLVTTRNEYTTDDVKMGGIITKEIGSLKEYQTVVAVGPMVRGIQVGDLVAINPKRYAVRKFKEGSLNDGVIQENPVMRYNFNVIELDHVPHLLLTDQDIDFIISKWEDEKVETPTQSIIIPEKKVIV